MEGYKANITFASKELTGKEKVMLKDLTNAVSLDDATDGNAPLVVDLDYYALIHIHNEHSENKEYDVCVFAHNSSPFLLLIWRCRRASMGGAAQSSNQRRLG